MRCVLLQSACKGIKWLPIGQGKACVWQNSTVMADLLAKVFPKAVMGYICADLQEGCLVMLSEEVFAHQQEAAAIAWVLPTASRVMGAARVKCS